MPDISVFKSDNRSSYNAMMLHVQGNVTHRFNLTANYVLSSAKTWGCVLGELFDYVNGVCNPLNPFAPGDYGPSGEDVLSRFTFAGIVYIPGGFQVTTLIQAESARPITLTTPVDVNGFGDPNQRSRGHQWRSDDIWTSSVERLTFRLISALPGRSRSGSVGRFMPFIEFFNLFNRNNPGANYVTDISASADAGEQSVQRHGTVPDSGVQRADHQPESVAGAGRSAGRFLRSRNDGGHPFRRATWSEGHLLTHDVRF